ncbi:DUF3426 domain-containing protein [Pandoraea pnomenusa]|uniref:DUF3426 domain-containing protein n=1 Tax=Pandoraea pnomenusa TaxID=93220 RepID=UPI00333FD5AD
MTQSSRVLATRCPHCHTVFRVVADQLKLRDGLVRCGHCREVFDGRAYLCDPPADDENDLSSIAAPASGGTDAAAPAGNTHALDATGEADASGVTDPASNAASISGDASARASTDKPPVPEMLTPTAIAALLGAPDESRAQMHHGPGRYIDDDATALPAPTASPARTESSSLAASGVRRSRPGAARVIWRLLMTIAVIALLAQWAWIERAGLVDRIPALRGVFTAVGRPMHVTIAPPRQPDVIQISSVTLVTDVRDVRDGRDVGDVSANDAANASDALARSAGDSASAAVGDAVPMTLTVFVRNQADYAVAWPSLELTLSDLDGKPVVRRVFSANDYVGDAALREAGLAPRNERTIRLRLSAQAALASNYRVLAFYP